MFIHDRIVMFPKEVQGGCLTIGFFDGVHLGHRRLITATVEKAKSFGVPSVALTFDRHPTKTLAPEKATAELFPREDMAHEIAQLGIDHLIIMPFTVETANVAAEDFISELVVRHIAPLAVIVGHDFSFGKSREGDFQLLRELGRRHGFECEQIVPVVLKEQVISSTAIRQKLSEGDVQGAADMLGRPFHILGEVIAGAGRGRTLNFPTINLKSEHARILKNGVYGTRLVLEGKAFDAVTNVGSRPTFEDAGEKLVETHVMGQKLDVYGKAVKLEFHFRLRDELKFPSADALMEQIGKDVQAAEREFARVSLDRDRPNQ